MKHRAGRIVPLIPAIVLVLSFGTGWTGCHLYSSDTSLPAFGYYLANSRTHTVYLDPTLSATAKTAFRNAMAEYSSKTTVRMTEVTTYSASTDVFVLNDTRGETTQRHWAITGCPYGTLAGNHPTKRCTGFKVFVYPAGIGSSASRWAHVACHELGHTLGLHHRNEHPELGDPHTSKSCMVTPTSGYPQNAHLDDMDIATIGLGYPAP